MIKKPNKTLRLLESLHPVIYEVNIRVFLNELGRAEGKKVTLNTIPDSIIDEWASLGLDGIWLMGVWTTGPAGKEIARTYPGLWEEYRRALPDCAEEDVAGSPYSVQAYAVPASVGGDEGLADLRNRLAVRGIGLILDFVGNHTARDHEWVSLHPEFFVGGAEGDDVARPEWYFRAATTRGDRVIAYGRDPTYPGWTDTAQINYLHPGARSAVIGQLEKVAAMCDGVRCDMAMLMLKEVFSRTWGERAVPRDGPRAVGEFWQDAIGAVRRSHPDFVFVAEAYWNLEWELQQLGFDFTYDKILYDRLLREGAGSVRDHLRADLDYQLHSLRFLENHDEQRAARSLPSEPWQYASAVIVSTVPGMLLLHEGQLEGRTVKIPVQLVRRPEEPGSDRTRSFYRQLLSCINVSVFRKGEWTLLNARPAWHENATWQNFLVFWWQEKGGGVRLVVANYAPHSGQCYVDLPVDRLGGQAIEFRDLMGPASYVREKTGLKTKGMYFDLPPYGIHIFELVAHRK